jgi:hypothetical protein
LKRTPRDDLDEFEREKLKNQEGHRKAFEPRETLSLVERGAGLLMAIACLAFALIDHSYAPSIPVFGWGLGRILPLMARRRP